jgi:hypothetical protein
MNWDTMLSALIGGAIAAVVAFLANRQAHKYQRELSRLDQQQKIDGILVAIRFELEILLNEYKLGVESRLEKLNDGQPFATYFKTSREYFIVYPKNTSIVGQIENSDLCKAIINTYHRASMLSDAIEVNSWNLERLLEFQKLLYQTNNLLFQKEYDDHLKGMAAFVPRLKENYACFKSETENLFAQIDDYRANHQNKDSN